MHRKAVAMNQTSSTAGGRHTDASCGEHSPSRYRSEHQRDVVNRLKRIEGQVRALIEMVESGRPCEDVAQQMSAARKAMDKAFFRMMACSVMESVALSDDETLREVERSTRILEKYA
jgi:DNA-binding FrmR family transcriptional regulator